MTPSWGVPVVIDLKGMILPKDQSPQLRDHDTGKVVGHADSFEAGATLKISGVMSGANDWTEEIITSSDNGYKWQQSVGIQAIQVRFIKKDEVVKVNGRVFKNMEFYLIEKSLLKENSYVALGADGNTSSNIAASRYKNNFLEEFKMDPKFLAWLKAMSFDETKLSAEQIASLQAKYDAETKLEASAENEDETEENEEPVSVPVKAAAPKSKVKKISAADKVFEDSANAVLRVEQIKNLTAGNATVQANALKEKWDDNKINLEMLRAERTGVPNQINDQGIAPNETQNVLQCALEASCGVLNEKEWDAKTLEAAHKHYKDIGMTETIVEVARKNGMSGRVSFASNGEQILRSAFNKNLSASAFSTLSLPGILSNIANKSIVRGFNSVDQAWRKIASIGRTSDFKLVSKYALTGDNVFEALAADGEIKHGGLSEVSYTNQVATYAKMLQITRKMLIDDDKGALSSVPFRLGRGGGLKLNNVFWTVFMANTNVFNTDNSKLNYISGATSNLGIAGLTQAVTAFMKQIDPDGQPMALMPKIILAPVEAAIAGQQLVHDTQIIQSGVGASALSISNQNPHAGKHDLVTTPYLSNTTFTGNSTTAWYLIADPVDMPLIEMLFLNGKQSPTVETTDADFNQLGIQMRGYFDFGAAFQEYRSGLKSKGAA